MHRLERLYAINEAVRRSPPPVSAARLAEEFGVSRRTIERDLGALRSAGVPLYAEHGRNGGQRSVAAPDRVVVTLSVAEVSSLLIALAAGGPDLPFSDAGRTATARLLDGLPDATRVGVEHLRSRVRTRPDPDARPRVRVRRTLEQGVRRSLVVNLDYCDRNGETTTRSVDGAGFLHAPDGWYLVGWCHLRQAGRMFRLDRITSARLTKRAAIEHDLDDTLGWVPFAVAPP
ncbi:MAG: HTH domain-containing protein [Acidimicrobiales bacterium]